MDEWSFENVLFGPSYAREHTINAPDPTIQQTNGAVTATVDPTFAYAQFRKRAAVTFFGGLLKSALASAAFYVLFFFSMTQPLSALARQVRDPDPTGDVNSQIAYPPCINKTSSNKLPIPRTTKLCISESIFNVFKPPIKN